MSAEVTIQGALEVRTYSRSQKAIRLVSCPFCGHTFESHEPRWRHFLEEHDPEDAGLSPIGEHTERRLVTDGGERTPYSERTARLNTEQEPPTEPARTKIDTDALARELRASNARSCLVHVLEVLEEIESADRSRFHVREAIGTLDAALEVER